MLPRLLRLVPRRLPSLFPSSLPGALAVASQPAAHWAGRVCGARLGVGPFAQPGNPVAGCQSHVAVLGVPGVPAAQQAGVTALVLLGLGHALHEGLAARGLPEAAARPAQGLRSLFCMAGRQGAEL